LVSEYQQYQDATAEEENEMDEEGEQQKAWETSLLKKTWLIYNLLSTFINI
jgi:hypothetical protein